MVRDGATDEVIALDSERLPVDEALAWSSIEFEGPALALAAWPA